MNRTIFLVGLLLLCLGVAACAGFDAGDFIRVDTPTNVERTHGLPDTLTLNKASIEYEAWHEDVLRDASLWKRDIERADHLRGMFNQLTLGALDALGPTLAGVPVLAPILPTALGLWGLFTRRPGDVNAEQLRREKEASYNAGRKAAEELLKAVKA